MFTGSPADSNFKAALPVIASTVVVLLATSIPKTHAVYPYNPAYIARVPHPCMCYELHARLHRARVRDEPQIFQVELQP